MEKSELNLYQKLLEIQKKVMGLGKDAKSFTYKYVSPTKVLESIKPLMNEYGLILKQEVISIENTRQDYTTNKGAKSEILSKVMMKFTWIDCNTGEKDENLFGANGQNDWEKGLGSALTYAERYFLLKFFHINTDEDDIDNPSRSKSEPVPIPQRVQQVAPPLQKIILVQNSKNWDDVKTAMISGVNGKKYLITDIEKKYIISEKERFELLSQVLDYEQLQQQIA